MKRVLLVVVALAVISGVTATVVAQDRPRTPTRQLGMEMAWPRDLDRRAELVGPVQPWGSNNLVYTFRERGAIKVLVIELRGTELGDYSLLILRP